MVRRETILGRQEGLAKQEMDGGRVCSGKDGKQRFKSFPIYKGAAYFDLILPHILIFPANMKGLEVPSCELCEIALYEMIKCQLEGQYLSVQKACRYLPDFI